MLKSTLKLLAPILILSFALAGCQFFTEGKLKLANYCPGLKIGIDKMSYSYSAGKTFYAIKYDAPDQGTVKTYFDKKENGFMALKNGDFYDIKMDDAPVIDSSDNILGKIFKHRKGNTEVIFNETTRRIIIIENSD